MTLACSFSVPVLFELAGTRRSAAKLLMAKNSCCELTLLATGTPLEQITQELGHVAEGVPAAHEVQRRAAALGVRMPITDWVCAVLDGSMTPTQGVAALMERDIGFEGE